MDSTLIDTALSWIAAHPHWAYFIIALIAFGESLAIVGLIVPGALLLFGVGALIGSGELALWPTLIATAIGAILGDGISFWLGYHFRERLADLWPFNRYPKLMKRGVVFFKRHGGKSILFGRFVGPVRPIVPAVAGMMRMSVPKYISINLISAIAWAPAYLLPAAFFVGYAKEEVAAVTTHVILVILLISAVGWLIFLALRLCFFRKPIVTLVSVFALAFLSYLKLPIVHNTDTAVTSHWQTKLSVTKALQEYGWSQADRLSIKSILLWFDPQVSGHHLPLINDSCLAPSSRWTHSSNLNDYFISWCVDPESSGPESIRQIKGQFRAYRVLNFLSLFRIPIQDKTIEPLAEQLQELFLATGQSYFWQRGDEGRELVLE
ncbi:MAG: DedA family protein [Gammaproteobacteria bacterium]|nr:DedA family protein [Gammaproteobacteria bacterium]